MSIADVPAVQALFDNLIASAGTQEYDERLAAWRRTVRALPLADGWQTTVVQLDDVVHAHLTAANFDPTLSNYLLCGADVYLATEERPRDSFTGWSPSEGMTTCATCAAYDPFQP